MTLLQRILRNKPVLLGLVTATTGLLILFHVPITIEQAGGIFVFVGALIGLLQVVVTPAEEVVAQQRPGDAEPVAGPAAAVTTGAPVSVHLEQLPPPDPNKVDALDADAEPE
jgi:hypothetical protein